MAQLERNRTKNFDCIDGVDWLDFDPSDPEVIQARTRLARSMDDPDPWQSRCYWDADLAREGRERRW